MPSGSLIDAPACCGRGPAGRDGLIVVLALLAVSAAALFSLPQGAAATARPLAIVFLPWISGEDALARSLAAGHRVVRSGISPFIVVTAPVTGPDAVPARPQGALLMLNLDGLAGCLDSSTPVEPAL